MASIHRDKNAVSITPRERLAREVYGRVDDAVDRELGRLRRDEGIVASCKRGCCSCCGQHIQTNPAEAHALGQYIRRTFSAQQIGGLRRRMRQWHAWDGARRKGEPTAERPGGWDPRCPLLVQRACSAYPARPIICRTHYVSSDPAACRPSHDDRPVDQAPVVLTPILHAVQPLSQPLRAAIEADGLEFSRSIMLLPHWLAIEMGWDFAEEG